MKTRPSASEEVLKPAGGMCDRAMSEEVLKPAGGMCDRAMSACAKALKASRPEYINSVCLDLVEK